MLIYNNCPRVEIGRQLRLRFLCRKACWFESSRGHKGTLLICTNMKKEELFGRGFYSVKKVEWKNLDENIKSKVVESLKNVTDFLTANGFKKALERIKNLPPEEIFEFAANFRSGDSFLDAFANYDVWNEKDTIQIPLATYERTKDPDFIKLALRHDLFHFAFGHEYKSYGKRNTTGTEVLPSKDITKAGFRIFRFGLGKYFSSRYGTGGYTSFFEGITEGFIEELAVLSGDGYESNSREHKFFRIVLDLICKKIFDKINSDDDFSRKAEAILGKYGKDSYLKFKLVFINNLGNNNYKVLQLVDDVFGVGTSKRMASFGPHSVDTYEFFLHLIGRSFDNHNRVIHWVNSGMVSTYEDFFDPEYDK